MQKVYFVCTKRGNPNWFEVTDLVNVLVQYYYNRGRDEYVRADQYLNLTFNIGFAGSGGGGMYCNVM